ncbi:MAG: histidine phosphatase family protein [Clostridium sp.]|uniref:histidine phosphatase family protein n=1 Tax=Clostridium sp. TaxID=1506 RepID=UPI0025C17747|nr:histidine phosphatase family protein [Clostridium sp.]MCH3965767.1 histidine phosphatase family protein [Clostridium sp.]MCI1717176.1 histidine phosphatase family protein [Clostridium sp.]MCI1801516.1 histidine phosphatase family protein [Clostridium sp.]MCI1815353.1 histidine phosphatase family protein [Clostridium sp.]MCI1872256.1 histidine phosphatase family protein [Clostridium sp.]
MQTELLLIRHGQTEWNTLGKFQGCSDIELAPDGITQAEYLARHLNGNFDYIYSSPLKRARKTAEIISENTGKQPMIANNLREINYGKWEGLTSREILTNYEKEYIRWKTDTEEAPLCGGDLSLKNACKRARGVLMDIVNKNSHKKIAVVAHGGIIKAGLVALFDWELSMYHKIVLLNTSVSKIIFDDNLSPMIYTINDTSHLPK